MTFIDQGEFQATKMPISHRTLRCDKGQFRAKMTVSTSTVCEISLLSIVVVTLRRIRKMHFRYCILLHLAVFRVAFGHFYEAC